MRFARIKDNQSPTDFISWPASLYESPEAAISAYRDRLTKSAPDGLALCAAGPVKNNRTTLTNGNWVLDGDALCQSLNLKNVLIYNDLAAVAAGLPALDTSRPHEVTPIGPQKKKQSRHNQVLTVVAPGTGLGIASLFRSGSVSLPLAGEGGHIELGIQNDREMAVLYQLRQEFGYVSAETVVSGPGLENLYMALAALDGTPISNRPKALDITRLAKEGNFLACETISLFTAWLGSVAGNTALLVGAQTLFIGGGIIPNWENLFDHTLFRYRFENKGAMQSYMRDIHTALILRKDIAMLGLARLLQTDTF